MHLEQFKFFEAVVDVNRELIECARVLEIGSYDVNGSVRGLFTPASQYIGVDLTAGPSVDLVAFGHELDEPDESFDISLSGECFEHDPHWRDTFTNMVRMTRPGGLVVFSCASRGRLEHGTSRTWKSHSPGTQAVGMNYYRNLNAKDFRKLPLAYMFREHRFWYQPTHHDLFFAGIKNGESVAQIPSDVAIEGLRYLMPFRKRVLHATMRLASRLLPEGQYQNTAWLARKILMRNPS